MVWLWIALVIFLFFLALMALSRVSVSSGKPPTSGVTPPKSEAGVPHSESSHRARRPSGITPPAPVSPPSPPPEIHSKLTVGMPIASARASLDKANIIDITETVEAIYKKQRGLIFEARWYLLPDATCLHIYAECPEAAGEVGLVIKYMDLGEKGRGHKGRADWAAQKRTDTKELDLTTLREKVD